MKAVNEKEYVCSGGDAAYTQTQLISTFWVMAHKIADVMFLMLIN